MAIRDPFPRSSTPRPNSSFRIITKRTSYQSLRSPVLMSPVLMSPAGTKTFSSFEVGLPQPSPGWEQINVTSPSTASHRSLRSNVDDDFRSPRLGLMTNNLLGSHLHENDGAYTLTSPSAPVQLPGDELLYSIATEERPDEPFFDPTFQTALATMKQEMKDISLATWGCPLSHRQGSDLHALKQRAHQLSEFEPSRTRTIGIVGASGRGKSNVINALLDQPHLAPTICDSSHHPSVITEYRYRSAHHDEPFSIAVDYMAAEEIQDLIEGLLKDFRACHIPAYQDIDDEDERRKIRVLSETAWNTLHSMFRNQPLFSRKFLLGYPSAAEFPLLGVLQQWSADFLSRRPGGPTCRSWTTTAFNIEDFGDKLDPFVRDPVDEKTSALWPFVRVIRIELRSPILESGLVLVECPAPRELNPARARASDRYLRYCHEIFVVTKISNALVDEDLADIVERNDGHRPVHVICTDAGIIDARDVERTELDIALQVRTWRQEIEALRKQVKRNEAQRQLGMYGSLEEEVHNRDILQELEFGLKKFLVERRNRKVGSALLLKYATKVQDEIQMFFADDRDYFEHRFDEQSRAEARLELSGIVRLRKYCHSVSAKAQLAEATAFMERDVPTFLGSLKQWVISGIDNVPPEKTNDLCNLLKSLEDVVVNNLTQPTAHMHTAKTNLNLEFASSIVNPIRERRTEYRKSALEASKAWNKFPTKTYAAICRAHGHSTTLSQNWDAAIIHTMRTHLTPAFTFYLASLSHHKANLLTSITTVFASVSHSLQCRASDSPLSINNLITTLPARLAVIQHLVETCFATLVEGTQHLQSDLLCAHTSSYISTLMAPAYQEASELRLPGNNRADATPQQVMTSYIASGRLFLKLSTMVERAHKGLVSSVFESLIGGVGREVDAMVRDLRTAAPRLDIPVEIPLHGAILDGEDDKSYETRDGNGNGEAEKVQTETVMERQKSEAEMYAEFSARLLERLGVSERVVSEMTGVIGSVSRKSGSRNGSRSGSRSGSPSMGQM